MVFLFCSIGFPLPYHAFETIHVCFSMHNILNIVSIVLFKYSVSYTEIIKLFECYVSICNVSP